MSTAAAEEKIHDLVGVGIGPFNLGLAALAAPLELDCVFLDSEEEFRWHHGMMLDGATIQVPFMADLVTMADPTSRYSFLNWLKQVGRLYPFYIREDFHALRAEFDQYYRWVAGQLDSLRWGRTVEQVDYDAESDLFTVTALREGSGLEGSGVEGSGVETYWARSLVLGIGTEPHLPAPLRELAEQAPERIRHTSRFLDEREQALSQRSVAVVGSGQSAAEVYLELLESQPEHGARVEWITRSARFQPMEDTPLTLEMTSPEYTDHFHALPAPRRDELLAQQQTLYKGISAELVDRIYEALYRHSAVREMDTVLLADAEVTSAVAGPDGVELSLHHSQTGQSSRHQVGQIVAATGYRPRRPDFLAPVEKLLRRMPDGRLDVTRDYRIDALEGSGGDESARGRIFVQNGEEHTHGLSAPDLGMGAYRSARILASLTGREVYPLERRIAFQDFGPAEQTQETRA